MLKIFRKIRQKLIADSKFSKYLLYAIGEIVLVVIGILIALSINNWNEARKNVKKEALLVKNIIEDLKLDSIQREEEIHLGFDPGIDFQGFGNNYYVQYRVYIVANRLYQLAVLKEGEYCDEKKVEDFFSSFEVMRR